MTASSDKKSKPVSRGSAPKLLRRAGERSAVPRRLEFEQDSSSVTALKPPAPLPPTPLEDDQDEWLEQIPTHPEQIPDLGALAGRSDTSIPQWARAQRKASVMGDDKPSASQLPQHRHHSPRPETTHRVTRQSTPSLTLLALVAAAFLAVGMVLGALLQSRVGGKDACPEPAAHQNPMSPDPGSPGS